MKNIAKTASCIAALLLAMAASAGISHGQGPDAEKIGKMLEELASLQAGVSQEQKVHEGLDADKKFLEGQAKTIDGMDKQNTQDWSVYNRDLEAYNADKSRFEAGKSAYIAAYGCWDCKREGKTADEQTRRAQEAELSVLNPLNDRLNAELERLTAKYNELNKTADLVKEGKETWNKAATDWNAKKKASDANINGLIAQYQQWTKACAEVLSGAQLSEDGKKIAYSNNRPVVVGGRTVGMASGLDFGVLSGAMDNARGLLQQARDGSSGGGHTALDQAHTSDKETRQGLASGSADVMKEQSNKVFDNPVPLEKSGINPAVDLRDVGKAPKMPDYVLKDEQVQNMQKERDASLATQRKKDAELATLRKEIEATSDSTKKGELMVEAAKVKEESSRAEYNAALADKNIKKRAQLLIDTHVENPAGQKDEKTAQPPQDKGPGQ